MELIQNLTKPMLLIALAGTLTTSTANAQFVQDHDHPVIEVHEHLDSDSGHTSKWVQKVDDDEHVYVLEMTNGVFTAMVDGKNIPQPQIHNKGSVVVLVDDQGEKIYEFKVPTTNGIAVYPSQNVFVGENNTARGFAWVAADADDEDNIELKVNIEQPKVMLGINMSEPGEALRKHLKLGADRQVIMVEKAIKGLPAAKAGMESYDIIVSIDGSDEASGEILHKALMGHEPGEKLSLWVLRGGEKIKLTPKLAAYDAEKLGATNVNIAVQSDHEAPQDSWFSDDGKMKVLVERLANQQGGSEKLHAEMMKRAEEAIAQAERQVLELRGNQLFVHRQKAEDVQSMITDKLRALEGIEVRDLLGAEGREHLEGRLGELEGRFDSLEARMEQVAGLIEQMFEKMAEDED